MSLSQRPQIEPAQHGSNHDRVGAMVDYSTNRISRPLLNEVSKALKSIDAYGSVEIYVHNRTVTQITVRNIKKTNGFGPEKSNKIR